MNCKHVRAFESLPVADLTQRLEAATSTHERLAILLALGFWMAPRQVDEAENYNAQATVLVQAQSSSSLCKVLLKRNAAHCALYRNDYSAALILVDECYSLCQELPDCDTGVLDLIRASAYTSLGNYLEAQAAAEAALTSAETSGETRVQTSALSILGSVAAMTKNFDVAIDCYQRCIPIYEANRSVRGLGKVNNNLSQVYLEMDRLDDGRSAAEKAMHYYHQAGDKRGEYYVNSLLGLVHSRLKEYERSVHYYRLSVEIADAINDRLEYARACLELARVQQFQDNYQEAKTTLLDALSAAQSVDSVSTISEIHKELAICYECLGNYKLALQHERAHYKLHVEMNEAKVNLRLKQSQAYLEAKLARKDVVVARLKEAEARHQLEHADRLTSLGKLASSIAHEINNPLQAIYGGLLLLTDEENIIDVDKRQTMLSLAIENIERVTVLVAGMRDMYQINIGEIKSLNLSEQVNKVLLLIHKKIESQQVKLITTLDDDLPPLKAVPAHIQQMMLNFILNAIDAMPDGGRLDIRTTSDEKSVILEVEDNGEGIEERALPLLFDPFYTTRKHGSGLGLSICRNLANQYGGTITINSQLGSGTIVIVRFLIESNNLPTQGDR